MNLKIAFLYLLNFLLMSLLCMAPSKPPMLRLKILLLLVCFPHLAFSVIQLKNWGSEAEPRRGANTRDRSKKS